MYIQPKLKNQLESMAAERALPRRYVDDFIAHVVPRVDVGLLDTRFSKPQILGVQGCQGSGKSTLCEFMKVYIQSKFGVSVEICSLDDFYLTQEEREELSKAVHPLLATRGVPGTHDVEMIHRVFKDLENGSLTSVPVFDKAADDRAAKDLWPHWSSSPSVLIFEGWCVGIPHQAEDQLFAPVNHLEELEDPQQVWRRYVNQNLKDAYQKINSRLDSLLVLQAPSFECVYEWRLEQEQKMIAQRVQRGLAYSNSMDATEIKRFISHYQRLTEHGLVTLPKLADATVYLNPDHSFDKGLVKVG